MRYLAAIVAVITCPCHLPVLAALLAGTALGGLLTQHMGLGIAAFTVLFIGSAWTAVRMFSREPSTTDRARRTK